VVSEQGLSVYGGRKSVENNGGFVKKKMLRKRKRKNWEEEFERVSCVGSSVCIFKNLTESEIVPWNTLL
jgi:hypothetical protein